MKLPSSESGIDLAAQSREDPNERIVPGAESDAIEIDKLGDSVRIDRSPRAQAGDREVLRQPLIE